MALPISFAPMIRQMIAVMVAFSRTIQSCTREGSWGRARPSGGAAGPTDGLHLPVEHHGPARLDVG
jgi:hypothetical protein